MANTGGNIPTPPTDSLVGYVMGTGAFVTIQTLGPNELASLG